MAKTSEIADQNSEFAEILQSAQQCILEAQNEANRAQSEANRAQVEAQGAQRIQLATETMLDRARPEIEDAVGRSEAAVLTIQGTSGLVDQRIKFFEELAAKCTRETHAALDKLNTSQSSGPSAPPPPGSGGSVPHLEAEIRKVQDMAEACRLHAGNAMRSAQEALGSQTTAHENAVAAAQAAAGMSRVDTQVAGPSSHTCTAQFTPELQVQIELLNPQMKEMNNALQLAINNVADMATDKFASVSARVQDFEDSLLGKLGSPENGGPRLGDLDLDIQAHSDQLTRIWEQLEMQNHDLDLYLETLRDMEKKGAQNEPERQQNSRSEGPRDSRANPQPTSRRTGGETGPGTTTDGQRGLTGLVGHALGIGLGMMYRIGGLGVGKALRVTEAAGLGFLGVGILNTCMMISGIFHHHHLGGRKARGVHCRDATGSEVMLGGSR